MDAAGPTGPTHRMTLETVWPLFRLRILTERLVLRLPTDPEIPAMIELAKAGIHPPDEMPFGVAWTRTSSPDFERGFIQFHWRARATWQPDDWMLNLVALLDDEPIGSQSLMATRFSVHRTVSTGSWLGAAFQGRGFGKEMRAAVLAFSFDGLGARVAETEAYLDNAASNGVSRSLGYVENGRSRSAPDGVSREMQRFDMTEAQWRSRPRPPIVIEGLEACRELFGA